MMWDSGTGVGVRRTQDEDNALDAGMCRGMIAGHVQQCHPHQADRPYD